MSIRCRFQCDTITKGDMTSIQLSPMHGGRDTDHEHKGPEHKDGCEHVTWSGGLLALSTNNAKAIEQFAVGQIYIVEIDALVATIVAPPPIVPDKFKVPHANPDAPLFEASGTITPGPFPASDDPKSIRRADIVAAAEAAKMTVARVDQIDQESLAASNPDAFTPTEADPTDPGPGRSHHRGKRG